MLRIVLTGIQLFSAVIIVALVLLQRGRGADAGAGFGAGASGTVFGARGATTGLSRATAIAAIIFMINSLVLAYTGKQEVAAAPKPLLETTTPAPTNKAPSMPAPGPSVPAVGSPTPAAGPTAPAAGSTAPAPSEPAKQ